MTARHAVLAPSSAHRWANCPGSVALSAQVPPSLGSEYAAEGTVAHMLAEELLVGKTNRIDLYALIGQVKHHGGFDVEVTDEMVDAATDYVDLVTGDQKTLTAIPRPAAVCLEVELRIQATSVDPDAVWGMSDAVLYRKGHKLIVYDFKFGRGVVVEARENEQLALYAVGVMDQRAGWAFDEVELVIFQPRARHAEGVVRRWSTTPAWLREFVGRMKKAVTATKQEGAPVIAGDWCRWCPAQALCPAMYQAAQTAAQADFSVAPTPERQQLPVVRLMPPEKLAAALVWEDAITAWYGAVREVAKEMLSNGRSVPGWKLVDGRSIRKWGNEDAVVAMFGQIVGERLYERKILSPAKLEKIVGKGKVDHLTVRTEPPKTIARDTDARPAVASSAQSDFDVLPALVVEKYPDLAPATSVPTPDPLAELVGGSGGAENGRKRVWP